MIISLTNVFKFVVHLLLKLTAIIVVDIYDSCEPLLDQMTLLSLMSSYVWNLSSTVHVTLFQTYSLTRVLPCERESHVTNAGLFRKGFVLTLTQISCRPAEHRANQGEKRRRPILTELFTPCFSFACFSSHIFSPPSPKIGSIACSLRSVFTPLLFKDTIDLQNESQSLSARCSGTTFLCVWIGRPCICSI